jgi:hypothetical protein
MQIAVWSMLPVATVKAVSCPLEEKRLIYSWASVTSLQWEKACGSSQMETVETRLSPPGIKIVHF